MELVIAQDFEGLFDDSEVEILSKVLDVKGILKDQEHADGWLYLSFGALNMHTTCSRWCGNCLGILGFSFLYLSTCIYKSFT